MTQIVPQVSWQQERSIMSARNVGFRAAGISVLTLAALSSGMVTAQAIGTATTPPPTGEVCDLGLRASEPFASPVVWCPTETSARSADGVISYHIKH